MNADGLHVGVVGAGNIGRGFAVAFAAAGARVRLHDPQPGAMGAALDGIAASLADLAAHGLMAEPAEAALARIEAVDDLADAVAGADLVEECAPEDRAIKQALFKTLDRLADPSTVLASASSAMPVSGIAAGLPGAARCMVAHPGNPPFLLRVIELVPAPFTDPAMMDRAADIFARCGIAPIRLGREIEGFVFNRLQGAMLREAYCLVRDGVASVDEIDAIVRDGLGLRWSVVGPFETVDLNTRGGIAEHARRLGPAYARMGAERGQHDPWTPDLVAKVTAARRARLPADQLDQRVRWRDARIMATLASRNPG